MKKITSVGVAVLVGAVATGCANADAAGAPADAAALERGRALYQDVSQSLYGSPADRLAAEEDTAARYQGALAKCMKAKGFTYQQAPSEKQNGGPISPGDLTSIAEIGRGDFGIATAKRNTAEVVDKLNAAQQSAGKMTAEQEAEYGKALGDCTPEASNVQEVALPSHGAAGRELVGIFREVEKTPAVADALNAYGSCMSGAGFKATSYLAIYQQAQDKFPSADLGWAALQNDPQWAEAVAFEKKAAAADATCRQPAQDKALAAGAPKLQAFVTNNRAVLDAADANWAKIRS